MSTVFSTDFATLDKPTFDAEWREWTPLWKHACCESRLTDSGLRVESPQEPFGVGGIVRDFPVKEGQAYRFEASASMSDVPNPIQSIQLRVTWMKADQSLHPAGSFVNATVADGSIRFNDTHIAPEGCVRGSLALETKWLRGGTLVWQRVAVSETETPKPRIARIGTLYLRPRNSTPERNLELFCEQIDAAGALNLDILCLPEAMTQIGTSQDVDTLAEAIPGPSTAILGEAAKRNNIWLVACLTERDGDRLYNTAVLINRQGEVAGVYRKVHLPREEWKKGFTPGDDYPVFQTDVGVIAMQICYDWFFPEPHAIFAMRGAEIIFAPTWGTTFKDQDGRAEGETVFRVRARDNGVYMVPSVYDGNSLIIDPLGRILASNDGKDGIAWAEVNLNDREPLWWVGHWRSIGVRHRMPETYGHIVARMCS